MKPSKKLLFSTPILAGVLCISPAFGQSSHAEADPLKAPTPQAANQGVAQATAETPASTSSSLTPQPGKLGFSDKRFVTKTAEGGQLEIALADLASQKAASPEVRNFAQQLVSDHTAMSMQLAKIAAAKGISEDVAKYAPREGAIALATASEPSTVAHIDVAPPRNQPGQTNYDETQKQARATADGVATLPPPVTSDVPTGSKATRDLASTDATAIDRTRANPDSGVAGAPTGPDIPAEAKEWNDPTKDRDYKKLAGKSGAEFDQAFISAMVSDHEKEVEQFEKRAKDGSDMDVKEFAAGNVAKLREHLEKARSLSSKAVTP